MKYSFNNCNIEAKQIGENNQYYENHENKNIWTTTDWELLDNYIKLELDKLNKESTRYEIAEAVKKSVDCKDKKSLFMNIKKYMPSVVVETISGLAVNGVIEVIKKMLL